MIHHFIRLLSFISCDYSPTRAVLYVPLYHFPGVGGVGPNGKSLSWGSLSLMIDLICSFLVLRLSHIDFYNIIYKGFSENVESVKKLVSTQKLEQIWGRILWDLIWICVMSLDIWSQCAWCLPPKKWDVKRDTHTFYAWFLCHLSTLLLLLGSSDDFFYDHNILIQRVKEVIKAKFPLLKIFSKTHLTWWDLCYKILLESKSQKSSLFSVLFCYLLCCFLCNMRQSCIQVR